MTELLRKAFERADRLPPSEQDALASFLMAELLGDGGGLAGPVWDLDAELRALGPAPEPEGRDRCCDPGLIAKAAAIMPGTLPAAGEVR